uniref:Uncharacterized protein n=1 Tax=Knipowitschia caucasica TaxID=637954 RepID=A0AAV2JWA3_KNICA
MHKPFSKCQLGLLGASVPTAHSRQPRSSLTLPYVELFYAPPGFPGGPVPLGRRRQLFLEKPAIRTGSERCVFGRFVLRGMVTLPPAPVRGTVPEVLVQGSPWGFVKFKFCAGIMVLTHLAQSNWAKAVVLYGSEEGPVMAGPLGVSRETMSQEEAY